MAPRRLRCARPARLLRTQAERRRRHRRFCHNSNSSPLLAFAPPVVLQVGSKGTDLQRSTTAPAAVAEEQERQGTTGLPKEEGHKESLVATLKQAPAFSSGRADSEEGVPDLRLPCQLPVRPAAQPPDHRSPARHGPGAGGYRQAAFSNHDRDIDGDSSIANNARQSFGPDPRAQDRGGAPDGSPQHPRIAGGYRGGFTPPFGAPGGAGPGGHPPAPAAGVPPPPAPTVPNRLPVAQPGEPVVDTRGYRFIHSLLNPPGLSPNWPMSSVQSLAFFLQLTTVVGDEPAAHQALSELDGMCFRAGGVGTSSSTFVNEDIR